MKNINGIKSSSKSAAKPKSRLLAFRAAAGVVAISAVAALGLSIRLSFADSWSEPSGAPPNPNVSAPIWNQNSAAQAGGFWISGNGLMSKAGIGNSSPSALLSLGTAGSTLGTLSMAGSSSGTVTVQPAAAAGTWTLTLPTSAGTSGYFLQTNGSGVTTWASASGGSQTPWTTAINAAGYTLNGNSTASGNMTIDSTSNATKGYVLLNPSGGNVGIGNSAPTASLSLGTAGARIGTLSMAGNTSGTVTIRPAAAAGTWTLTLPASAGSAGQILSTNGSGTLSWVNDQTGTSGLAGSGTANYVARFTGASTLGNSLIYDNGTNVGIGTASPVAKLDVTSSAANAAVSGTTTVGANTNGAGVAGYVGSSATSGYAYGVYGGSAGRATAVAGYNTGNSSTYGNGVTGSSSYGVGVYGTSSGTLSGSAGVVAANTAGGNALVVNGTTSFNGSIISAVSATGQVSSSTWVVAGSGFATSGRGSFTGQVNIGSNGYTNQDGDIGVARNGSPTTGVIYLGSGGSHYLYFDGTNYSMPSGGLTVGGQIVGNSVYATGTFYGPFGTIITVPGYAHTAVMTNSWNGNGDYLQLSAAGNGADTNAMVLYGNVAVGTYFVSSINAAGVWLTSDRALKKNIVALDDSRGLDVIGRLNPVSFNWKDSSQNQNTQYGFVAQDVQKVMPDLVINGAKGTLELNYNGLFAPVVKAIQQQQAEISGNKNDVDQKIADLQKQIDALRSKLK